MGKAAQHVQSIGVHDLWETPRGLLEKFCNETNLDIPKLDVCAINESKKCLSYFGPDHYDYFRTDAFKNDWDKNFFCNPPYSEVDKWLKYAREQCKRHLVIGICLVYAKTDTKWWSANVSECGDFVTSYFQKGRIRFWKNGKPGPSAAPYGSAWLVINPYKIII